MPFTLTMPKLSPTMEEGTITKWLKKEGEFVKAGELLLAVATDKATVEHQVLDAGWLRKILIEEGKTAIVNQAIAIFSESKEENIDGYQPEGIIPPVATPILKTPETQVATTSSVPQTSLAKGGELVSAVFVPEPPLAEYVFPFPSGEMEERLKASPLARKLAKEQGVDLTTVKGSGPHGRIVAEDVAKGQPVASVIFGHRETPSVQPGTYEEVPLTPMRKVIAQRLQESKTFIPHFYITQAIAADRLVAVRQELAALGIKITYNDFVVRAAALALREHPKVNSGFNSVTQSIISFKTIDVAVAVSIEAGLITPIVRHADFKNLGQISSEIRDLASRAKGGKLSREEYMGGSFTVSNIGMFGMEEFKAVINPPQAAILAVGGILEKPVVRNGAIVVGQEMKCTLSADHRVVDGADAALFMKTLQKFLENPSGLLLS